MTGSVGAGGEGKRESKIWSDEKGRGVPSSSYLERSRSGSGRAEILKK